MPILSAPRRPTLGTNGVGRSSELADHEQQARQHRSDPVGETLPAPHPDYRDTGWRSRSTGPWLISRARRPNASRDTACGIRPPCIYCKAAWRSIPSSCGSATTAPVPPHDKRMWCWLCAPAFCSATRAAVRVPRRLLHNLEIAQRVVLFEGRCRFDCRGRHNPVVHARACARFPWRFRPGLLRRVGDGLCDPVHLTIDCRIH